MVKMSKDNWSSVAEFLRPVECCKISRICKETKHLQQKRNIIPLGSERTENGPIQVDDVVEYLPTSTRYKVIWIRYDKIDWKTMVVGRSNSIGLRGVRVRLENLKTKKRKTEKTYMSRYGNWTIKYSTRNVEFRLHHNYFKPKHGPLRDMEYNYHWVGPEVTLPFDY